MVLDMNVFVRGLEIAPMRSLCGAGYIRQRFCGKAVQMIEGRGFGSEGLRGIWPGQVSWMDSFGDEAGCSMVLPHFPGRDAGPLAGTDDPVGGGGS
jgi:hypothetical protein